jgi:hypothetical protein
MFACPVYVTEAKIQAGKSLPAWMSRAKVGINLGISPTHARSVPLVLSLKTGLVSPQFHVKHDDLIETTEYKVGGVRLPTSRWQALAGFKKGTVSVTRPVNPAETLTIALKRPSSARGGSTNVINAPPTNDGIITNDDGPVDNMEEARVTVQTDPGDDGEGSSINQDEPAVKEPAVTTRSGRRVRMTARMQESPHYQRARKWVAWAALHCGRETTKWALYLPNRLPNQRAIW